MPNSQTPVFFTPPPQRDPLVQEAEVNDEKTFVLFRSWLKWFLALQLQSQMVLINSSGGVFTYNIPLASRNPGTEIILFKTSADANHVIAATTGSDLINGAANQNFALAQFGYVRIKSDGVSNWYIVT